MTDATSRPPAVGHNGTGLVPVVVRSWPLLTSILLLMVGSGLQSTLLGIRAEGAGFNTSVTGLVLSLYYLGYVAGSSWTPRLIRSVGHIRVFSSLASIGSASVLVHGVWILPVPWMLLRFTTGLCVAGLFIVSESWLNQVSTSRTRGTMLAVYNTVVTAGLAVGSLLLNTADVAGFVLFVMGSVLLSLAAVPVALAPHVAPVPESHQRRSLSDVFHSAPLGVAGAATSGFAVGASVGYGAVYASRVGFGVSGASQFVVSLLLGAIVGQIPLGRWSDRTDRRIVMGFAAALVIGGSALGIPATFAGSLPLVLVSGVIVGAGAFSLYGLSFAHIADYVAPAALAATGARIITVNGLAAAAGPFVASAAIALFGPEALFGLLAGLGAAFVLLVIVRRIVRAPVSKQRRARYVPVAASTTPANVYELGSEVSGVDLAQLRRRLRKYRPHVRRPRILGPRR